MNIEGIMFAIFTMLITLIIFVSIGALALLVTEKFTLFAIAALCDTVLAGAASYIYFMND